MSLNGFLNISITLLSVTTLWKIKTQKEAMVMTRFMLPRVAHCSEGCRFKSLA